MSERSKRDRDREKDRRRVGRSDRGSKGSKSRHSENQQEQPRPVILAKPDRDREFPTLLQAHQQHSQSQGESESAPELTTSAVAKHLLLARKENSASRSQSPKPSAVVENTSASTPAQKRSYMSARSMRLIDDQQFLESVAEYLTDNSDFFVVGIMGPQGTGKSTILNLLARGLDDPQTEADATKGNKVEHSDFFRVQSFEKQMTGEHSTNGASIWISPKHRVILIDTQPLNAPSVLDRMIQLEKKFSSEFSSFESTVEIQSLQLAGFLMSVCHAVIVCQDWSIDASFLRFLLRAEMFKPAIHATSPSSEGENSNQVVEYWPNVIFLHNRSPTEDFTEQRLLEMKRVYSRFFSRSQLKISSDSGLKLSEISGQRHREPEVPELECLNVFLLPDFDVDDGIDKVKFDQVFDIFRRKILSLPARPLSTLARQTERSWLSTSLKCWESIKTFQHYLEYSRLTTNG